MLGRNWCKIVNSHMRPCLHDWLLLIIWNCTYDPTFAHPKYRASCSRSLSNISFRIKQDKAELWKQKVIATSVAVATASSFLACANARLLVMLARAIFRSCWGLCTCVDTCTAWTDTVIKIAFKSNCYWLQAIIRNHFEWWWHWSVMLFTTDVDPD